MGDVTIATPSLPGGEAVSIATPSLPGGEAVSIATPSLPGEEVSLATVSRQSKMLRLRKEKLLLPPFRLKLLSGAAGSGRPQRTVATSSSSSSSLEEFSSLTSASSGGPAPGSSGSESLSSRSPGTLTTPPRIRGSRPPPAERRSHMVSVQLGGHA